MSRSRCDFLQCRHRRHGQREVRPSHRGLDPARQPLRVGCRSRLGRRRGHVRQSPARPRRAAPAAVPRRLPGSPGWPHQELRRRVAGVEVHAGILEGRHATGLPRSDEGALRYVHQQRNVGGPRRVPGATPDRAAAAMVSGSSPAAVRHPSPPSVIGPASTPPRVRRASRATERAAANGFGCRIRASRSTESARRPNRARASAPTSRPDPWAAPAGTPSRAHRESVSQASHRHPRQPVGWDGEGRPACCLGRRFRGDARPPGPAPGARALERAGPGPRG